MVKIFMRRGCSTGVSRQGVLDSGCHVADPGSSRAGAGKSSTLFLCRPALKSRILPSVDSLQHLTGQSSAWQTRPQ